MAGFKSVSEALDYVKRKEYKMYLNAKNEYRQRWRNIKLLKELYEIMLSLPDDLNTGSTRIKAHTLFNIVAWAPEFDCPRLCIEVRKTIEKLYLRVKDQSKVDATIELNAKRIKRLKDYINPNMSIAKFCKKHGYDKPVDPIERTQQWEDAIYQASLDATARIPAPESIPDRYNDKFEIELKKTLKEHGIIWRGNEDVDPQELLNETLDKFMTLDKKQVIERLDRLIDEFGYSDLYIYRTVYANCDNWNQLIIEDGEKFRKQMQIGVKEYGGLSPDAQFDWMVMSLLMPQNHPATFMDDLEEFYDILKKTVAESTVEENIETASRILKEIWNE